MQKIKTDPLGLDTDTIILIGEKIVRRHMYLGPGSPLNNVLIADLNSRISIAKQKHEEGLKYKKLMEDAWRDRDNYLGTKDKSVKFTILAIINKLKEENLNINDWGF